MGTISLSVITVPVSTVFSIQRGYGWIGMARLSLCRISALVPGRLGSSARSSAIPLGGRTSRQYS
jgi:hypothetical protein